MRVVTAYSDMYRHKSGSVSCQSLLQDLDPKPKLGIWLLLTQADQVQSAVSWRSLQPPGLGSLPAISTRMPPPDAWGEVFGMVWFSQDRVSLCSLAVLGFTL